MVENSLITTNINALGEGVVHPDGRRNFTQVNENRVNYLAGLGSAAVPYLENYIAAPKTFDGLIEALFVVDKMAENKVEGVAGLYPVLSKYNNSDCPEVQTMLSGIYRKTLVPDAFGPLCRMLHKQISAPPAGFFDASEETGGAILEYLRSYGACKAYPLPNVAHAPLQTNGNIQASVAPLQTGNGAQTPIAPGFAYRPYVPVYSQNGLRV